MRVVLQRVQSARVCVQDEIIGKINKGYLLLVGIDVNDTQKEVDYLVRKIANARLFSDEENKMNLSLQDVQGEILSVSQFTLLADIKKGTRPSFSKAAKGEQAYELYHLFNDGLRKLGIKVATGKFGEHMSVLLQNDGPVTIIYDTNDK